MKKLSLALSLLALVFSAGLQAAAYTTGMPAGIRIGTSPTSGTVTQQLVTGVAQSYEYLPLTDFRDGGLSTFANVSIATNAYFGQMTGATNTAVLVCPAVAGVSLTAKWTVPQNYGGGAVLQLKVHYSAVTLTASWITVTAKTFIQPETGLTTTTGTVGTGINPATTSGTVPNWITLTNAATYIPHDDVQFKVNVDSGNDAVRMEILDARVRYYPVGVQK